MNSEIPIQELPDWMRRAQQGLDWGLLLVIGLSLIAAWPFLLYTGLPRTNASENHVFNTADFAAALQEGRLYPRWSASAFGGYGAPIASYYPPLAAYAGALLYVLFTEDAVLAVRLVYTAAFVLAGVGVYGLARRRAGAAAAVLSAFLFLFSPYVMLTAPHQLGDLPGMVALALTAVLLVSTDRLIQRGARPVDLLLVTLSAAGLLLTHPPSTAAAFIIAGLLALWQRSTVRLLFWLAAACGLGGLIAAPYWIPALLEADAVSWLPPLIPSDHRLTLPAMLLPHTPLDPGQQLYIPQFTLGIILPLAALAGALAAAAGRRLTFSGAALAAGIGLSAAALLVFPTQVWLLGPISLCLALAASGIQSVRRRLPARGQRLMLPVLLVIGWLASLPAWLNGPAPGVFGRTDAAAQIRHELAGYGIAVLPPSLPIPTTLSPDVRVSRFLIEGYLQNAVNKIAPNQAIAAIQSGLLDHNTHSERLQISTGAPVRLNLLTAYFPGWWAAIDGLPTPLVRSPETGLIQIDVPEMVSSELVVELGSTPVRTGAWIIAGAALALTVLLMRLLARQNSGFEALDMLPQADARLLAVVLLCFAAALPLAALPGAPLRLRPAPGSGLAGAVPLQTRTDAGLSLLAFRADRTEYHRGETLELTLYWAAQRALPQNYRVRWHGIRSDEGQIGFETALRHPGGYPTRRWNTDRYTPDLYRLTLPSDARPGRYTLLVEVFDCDPDCSPDRRLIFFGSSGQLLGPSLLLPLTIVIMD